MTLQTRTTNLSHSTTSRVALFAWFFLALSHASAQSVRIVQPVEVSKIQPLLGARPAEVLLQDDRGPLPTSRSLSGITLVLKPSSSQIADLEEFLEQQRNPSSPNYRHWLTPEQYADRFGIGQ